MVIVAAPGRPGPKPPSGADKGGGGGGDKSCGDVTPFSLSVVEKVEKESAARVCAPLSPFSMMNFLSVGMRSVATKNGVKYLRSHRMKKRLDSDSASSSSESTSL